MENQKNETTETMIPKSKIREALEIIEASAFLPDENDDMKVIRLEDLKRELTKLL